MVFSYVVGVLILWVGGPFSSFDGVNKTPAYLSCSLTHLHMLSRRSFDLSWKDAVSSTSDTGLIMKKLNQGPLIKVFSLESRTC